MDLILFIFAFLGIFANVGRLAKATFIAFFVYLCSTNVELVTKPNQDNNKQIYLNHQLLLTCVVLSLEYYVSYRNTYTNTIYSHNSLQIFAQIRIQIFDLMQNKC
jgi:hypothetical protein